MANKSNYRPQPVGTKPGFTENRRRRYGNGGRVK